MRSSFNDEDNIELYDQQFYDYCNLIKDKELIENKKREALYTAGEIVKWYDDNRIKGQLPKFSFTCFDNWKSQGYWYPEFCTTLKAMGSFLKGGNEEGKGCARFTYEEGQPFEFKLDYQKKEVYVNYVPLVWETMRFKDKFPKIPKKLIKVMRQSDVEDAI